MQAVFRVKRRWEDKQAHGLKLAKRQRTDGEVPLILTYAGTTTKNDFRTIFSVIKSHQANDGDLPSVSDSGETSNSKTNALVDSTNADRCVIKDLEIDELFKIYDAHQDKIMNLRKESKDPKTQEEMGPEQKEGNKSNFVYDIYYVSKDSASKIDSMSIDYDERNYTLEYCCPENDILMNERDEEDEQNPPGYEDADSNAEDNPNNDYPDNEEYYDDNGQEVPHLLDDDDYYSYENYDHLSTLEQEMRDLCFHRDGDEHS